MKICFIAYADSIHTRRWVEYFGNNPKNEVHILTVLPCTTPIKDAIIHNLSAPGLIESSGQESSNWWLPVAKSIVDLIRSNGVGNTLMYALENASNWGLLPYRIFRCKNRAKKIIEEIRPDLIHCLGIPYGGSFGGLIGYHPLVVSTWGTDLVYFARKSRVFHWLTRSALSQADLLLVDNTRDKYLAEL